MVVYVLVEIRLETLTCGFCAPMDVVEGRVVGGVTQHGFSALTRISGESLYS